MIPASAYGAHVDLGARATPLQPLPRLRAALGPGCPRLFVKREDTSGLALGGNKLRKLEFLLADALADGATAVGSIGGATSNHLRLTAGAARHLGLAPYAFVLGDPDPAQGGNMALLAALGATVVGVPAAGAGARELGERARLDFEARCRAAGQRGAWITFGGTGLRGDLGYVRCAEELAADLKAQGGQARAIFVAVGTGGTAAGLAAGMAHLCPETEVVGYAVTPKGTQVFAGLPSVTAQIESVRQHLAQHGCACGPSRFRMMYTEVGAGYGEPTASATEAIALLAQHEALFTDPVYTGKALAGLIAEVRAGRYAAEDTVVFVHTGGWPGLFFRRATR